MQYLQKFIQKDLGFSYTLGESVASYDRADIWALHKGTSKENGDFGLIFHFNPAKASNTAQKQSLAKTGLMRLKTLRHPDILKYITSVEGSDGTLYVATEEATPLSTILSSKRNLDRESVQWGIFTIARALGFMHTSGLIHGRVNTSTIFVTPTGDWKLGGLECVTKHASASSLSQHAAALQSETYQSPEFAGGNWASVASGAPSAVDSWALGCLMYEAHAGSLTSPDQLQNVSVLPKPLLSAYQKLLASNATARAPAGQLLNHPYFQNSKYVELNMFVENLALKGQLEREAFLGKLPSIMDRLPDGFCTFKVLPMLSQSIESGAGGSAAFACIVKMKDRLSGVDFSRHVVKKYAVNWFGNQNLDRNLKAELFNQIQLFVDHFDDNALNNTIFPAMCAAFQDMQGPAVRDASVKAVLTISERLTDKNLNSVLMSHFARLQVDPEPAIRTNTTVCLGKLAQRLSNTAKNKVLAAAFLRSLKDPFPPARAAGVNAILITIDVYSTKDIATRLMPAIVPLLIDSSGEVRRLAFKVTSGFQDRLNRNHEEMTRAEESAAGTGTQNEGTGATRSGSGSSASGWGLSSFSSMTAALLNKTETTSSSTSTGISSDDFRKGRPATAVASNSYESSNGKASKASPAVSTQVSSDIWGSTNGNGKSTPSAPAAFSSIPLSVGTGTPHSSSFGDMGSLEETNFEDDDEDGWGDMDIKEDKEGLEDEDLFVSMMGAPKTKPRAVPGGLAKSGGSGKSSAQGGEDLWDLAPALVSKPKPKPSRPAGGLGMGGSTAVGRRGKKTGGDDWEALLGGTGTGSRRKTTGRSGGR